VITLSYALIPTCWLARLFPCKNKRRCSMRGPADQQAGEVFGSGLLRAWKMAC
jgi:hypothetical protein